MLLKLEDYSNTRSRLQDFVRDMAKLVKAKPPNINLAEHPTSFSGTSAFFLVLLLKKFSLRSPRHPKIRVPLVAGVDPPTPLSMGADPILVVRWSFAAGGESPPIKWTVTVSQLVVDDYVSPESIMQLRKTFKLRREDAVSDADFFGDDHFILK